MLVRMLKSKLIKLRLMLKRPPKNFNVRFKGSKKPLIELGLYSYVNDMLVYCWDSDSKISIGKYSSIADEVVIIAGGEHSKSWLSTFPFISRWKLDVDDFPLSKGDINIGHDVWIGNGATILSGVSIGTGAIIGARAVVAKDVPPYGVVVGNPARVVKYRFSDEIIARLLKSEWWDLDECILSQNASLMRSPEEFLNKVVFK
jgi:virginiamycin A acetyltransferase